MQFICTHLAIMNDDLKQRTMALVKALVVFGLAYPLTNDYTHALMSHTPTAVGSVASRYDVVPFVAWAIVPYSLSFVLFVLSFYVVSSAMLSRLLHPFGAWDVGGVPVLLCLSFGVCL